MAENSDWLLQGNYFETCNCETACPCIWLQPPSEGNCKLLAAWHIDKGHLGDLQLNDLNVALACYAPGHMKDGSWQAALYVDERADAKQFDALVQIFSGQVGGHLAVLMSFVSEVLGVKQIKIDFQREGDTGKLVIPDVAQAEIESIRGLTGLAPTIDNPPLCVVTSHPAVVARSKNYRYQDHGKDWTFSERNGFYSEFVYRPC